MARPWLPLLALVLTACPAEPEPLPHTDEESDSPDTDVDTDVYETGWTTPDTDPPDTDTDTDTGDSDIETGSPIFIDSNPCTFGETPDCDGTCFPTYFIGDGTCDDGTTFGANFACANFGNDDGDCGTPPPTCTYIVRIDARSGADRIGWQVVDDAGGIFTELRPGLYAEDFRIYDHAVQLPPGPLTFVALDAWADGWRAATWALIDPFTGATLFSGGVPDPDPTRTPAGPAPRPHRVETAITTPCLDPSFPVPVSCPLTLNFTTAADAPQVGWEVRAPSGFSLQRGAPGEFTPFQSASEPITLPEGAYTFRMTAGDRGGWDAGSHVEIAYQGGYIAGVGALTGFAAGGFSFTVDCDLDAAPPIPAPAAPVEVTCASQRITTTTSGDGLDLGFTLYRADTWQVVAFADPGTLPANSTRNSPITLPTSGRYALVYRDTAGNGWAPGTSMTLLDVPSGRTVLAPHTLSAGHQGAAFFEVRCTDQITDTAPEPPNPCAPGAIEDCDGTCWPQSYRDDGFCDDGVASPVNFACALHNQDGGDCAP